MENNTEQVLSKMTLDEKAEFLSGKDFWRTVGFDKYNIDSIMMCDGPHGLRKQSDSADNLGVNDSIVSVCFPTAVGLAASFNKELLFELGDILGKECKSENVDVLLGPAVNIKRSPLCGRNFEYFSEDPFLTGELAKQYVLGVQSNGIGTSIKHFAANSQERRRMTSSSVVDDRTLREIYLPAFENVVKNAHPWSVMCAYNKINGEYCSENKKLLTDILCNEWNFDGFTVSDWGAVNNRVRGVKNGLNLEMPSSFGVNKKHILQAVKDGELSEKDIDISCSKIMNVILNKKKSSKDVEKFDREKDHEKAKKMAGECMVLLKNNGILPIAKDKKVAFIGEFAKKPRFQGGGSSHINTYKVESSFDNAEEYNIEYSKGFGVLEKDIDMKKFVEAEALAKKCDIVVVFAGLSDNIESEGFDRKTLDLPKCQNELIKQLTGICKNVIVVLQNGSPVTMPWISDVAGVLEAYLGGEGAGAAIDDILWGKISPSAKLAETFPLSIEDTPCYDNFAKGDEVVQYREGIFVGYRYYDTAGKDVLFPFGYGLTYTDFEYSDLKTEATESGLNVFADITNTGDFDAAEVVQLYVSKQSSIIFRASKELKGFEKVYLKKGETKTVKFFLNSRSFSYFSIKDNAWLSEEGKYSILLASCINDIKLSADIVTGTVKESSYPREYFPEYFNANISNISDTEFENLLGFNIPKEKTATKLTLENSFEDAENGKWGKRINKIIRRVMSKGDGNGMGNTEMLVNATLENPLRSLVAMTQGLVNEKMTAALLNLLNDEQPLKNIIKLVISAIANLLKLKFGRKSQ